MVLARHGLIARSRTRTTLRGRSTRPPGACFDGGRAWPGAARARKRVRFRAHESVPIPAARSPRWRGGSCYTEPALRLLGHMLLVVAQKA